MKGKITNILNKYEIIINLGERDGVQLKDTFYIMEKKATEIIDPDTKEVLDSFFRKKARVIVTEVHQKYSICATPNTASTSVIQSSINALDLLSKSTHVHNVKAIERKQLTVDRREVDDIFSEYSNKTIHVGDIVEMK